MMTKNIISNLAKILTTGMRPVKGQGNVQSLTFLFHKIFLFYQHIEKEKKTPLIYFASFQIVNPIFNILGTSSCAV